MHWCQDLCLWSLRILAKVQGSPLGWVRMTRPSRILLHFVQILFLLSLSSRKGHKVDESDYPVSVHGQIAESSRGRELSSAVPMWNQLTKESATIMVGNYLKASAKLHLSRDLLFRNVLILCGDTTLDLARPATLWAWKSAIGTFNILPIGKWRRLGWGWQTQWGR